MVLLIFLHQPLMAEQAEVCLVYDNTVFSNTAAGTRTYPSLALFYDDLTAQGGVSEEH